MAEKHTARMTLRARLTATVAVLRRKPLQTGKLLGCFLAVVLGLGGFFRIIDVSGLFNDPLLGDGQFLALVLLPVVGLVLVGVVFLETLATGYRLLRSDTRIGERATRRVGYTLLRTVEAGIAFAGVAVMALAVPVLLAESTPAPAGVGIMLLLLMVGLGILVASFLRSLAELAVYGGPVS